MAASIEARTRVVQPVLPGVTWPPEWRQLELPVDTLATTPLTLPNLEVAGETTLRRSRPK